MGLCVCIYDHRAGAGRRDGAAEFRHGDEGAFDVEMAVDETRGEESALQIDDAAGFVIAEPDNATVLNGHVGRVNFSAENVDQAGVCEEEFSRLLTARDAEFAYKVSHRARLPALRGW
jgi:hypothetical protein